MPPTRQLYSRCWLDESRNRDRRKCAVFDDYFGSGADLGEQGWEVRAASVSGMWMVAIAEILNLIMASSEGSRLFVPRSLNAENLVFFAFSI